MKAVEEMGQLTLRNPHSGILHGKLDLLCIASERDANAPCKGMLEGVGEEVEDDFLPHVSVDIDRLCERRALRGGGPNPLLPLRRGAAFPCRLKTAPNPRVRSPPPPHPLRGRETQQ